MATKVSPAAALLQWWDRLKGRPGGHWVFDRILARAIPYTATVHPHVLAIEPGFARVQVEDRRSLRNHLNSIHAIALANLGELSGGLAMSATLPPDVRGILIGLRVAYLKKARGTLVAEARCDVPIVTAPIDYELQSHVMDASGDEVATITATWRLSPMK
jgi:acyl-coenzyme A thioesterase PaaI-like protein